MIRDLIKAACQRLGQEGYTGAALAQMKNKDGGTDSPEASRIMKRLQLAREFVALTIACLGALIVSAVMKLDEDTVIDFLKGIPIPALLDVARPPPADPPLPSLRRRDGQAKGGPGIREGRVLEYAAPTAYGGQRRSKTAVVRTPFVAIASLHQACQATPARTGRMCHHRPRAVVPAGVAGFVPQLHAVDTSVRPTRVNV